MAFTPDPLTEQQLALISQPASGHVFLEGPAGAGKTTASVERLLHLMERGIPGKHILLMLPHQTAAEHYRRALRHPGVVTGGDPAVVTPAALAQRMVDRYWEGIAEKAGFAAPQAGPTFLNVEAAQYYLSRLLAPHLEAGAFEPLVLDRSRLSLQILDNMNRAALVGFPLEEIGERLQAAAGDNPIQSRIYEDAQRFASRFRAHCLEHNLLDFSLQMELFIRLLWPSPEVQAYLQGTYSHLIADNVEENPPVVHDVLREWLPHTQSALLVFDHDAGYRYILGADPRTAYTLKAHCRTQIQFSQSLVTPPELEAFGKNVARSMSELTGAAAAVRDVETDGPPGLTRTPVAFSVQPFSPDMIRWASDEIARRVREEGIPPREIVVVAPYLTDSIRFALTDRLESQGIPVQSRQPSRPLIEDPGVRALVTLTSYAHPDWASTAPPLAVRRPDLARALAHTITGMDPVRAHLLADYAEPADGDVLELIPLRSLKTSTQERLPPPLRERYETLRRWLSEYRQGPLETPETFIERLYREVLSQPGFRFHGRQIGASPAQPLRESLAAFREAVGGQLSGDDRTLAVEHFLQLIDGVIPARYRLLAEAPTPEAISLSPVHTFLMSNRSVDYQLWLDLGSSGWDERLLQPVTHPFVLTRHWPLGKEWTDGDEVEISVRILSRLVMGLVRRCRREIILSASQRSEHGMENRGLLLEAVERILHGPRRPSEGTDV